jgi:hypothetical protein
MLFAYERPLRASSSRSPLPLVSAESGTDPFEILPLDAVVHQSSAHAVGGVITPGE